MKRYGNAISYGRTLNEMELNTMVCYGMGWYDG